MKGEVKLSAMATMSTRQLAALCDASNAECEANLGSTHRITAQCYLTSLEAHLLASEDVPQDLVQEKNTGLQRLDALASSVEVVEQAIVQAHIKGDAGEAAIQAQLQGETEPYRMATTFAAAVAVFKGNLAKRKADGFAAEEHYREAIQVLVTHYGKKDARVAAVTFLLKNAFVYS